MRKLLLLIGLALMASLAFAQVASYTFAYSAGSYTEITGGTVLGTAVLGGSGATALDDVLYTNTPLPFLFAFNGKRYNQLTVSTNGYLIIGGTSSLSYTPISSATACDGSIAILGKDLMGNVLSAGNLGEMRYETLGAYPNRVFVVQWKNFIRYTSGGNSESYNFQIRLKENGNLIEMVFGPMTVVYTSTYHPQLGLRGSSASDFINRKIDGTTTFWNNSAAGTVNTDIVTLTTTVYPTSGTTYTFTPPVVSSIPNVASVVSPANAATNVFATATLNWADGGGWTDGFKLYFGTTTPPPLVGDLGYVTSYDPPGDMSYNTPYFWKVEPYNGFGDQTTGSIWSFTTAEAPLTGTKTIGPGGNYISFTEAINALNGAGVGTGGVTFSVADGTYNESPPAITVSGTASNPIVFQSPGGNTVVTPAGGTGTFGFKLDGADYVTFDNIDINGPNTLIYGYWLANGAKNNTIKNCSITVPYGSTTNYGIYSYYGTSNPNSDCTIQNNTIVSSYNGIYIYHASGTEAVNVNIQGNSLSGIRNYGIYAYYCQNATIQYNNVGFYSGGTTAYYGIYAYGSSSSVNVHHNTISGGYTSSTVYALYNYYASGTWANNTVTNIYNTGSSTWYGCYDNNGGTSVWSNNTITGITITGTGAFYGFYPYYATTTTWDQNTISNISITSGTMYAASISYNTTAIFRYNVITGITTTGGTLYGCYIAGGTTNNVYSNKIYNLSYTGTSTLIVYGIYVSSGTTDNIYNNMIYDLKAPSSTATAPHIRAIALNGGTNLNVWNNSVYLNSTNSNASFATAPLYISTSTATIDLMNNILVNKSTPGTSGRNVAIWKTTAGVSNFSTTTDKNIYYCGEPDATHNIGYFNSVAYQTLADYKTMAATKDQGSYTEDVPFVSATRVIDLHINPTVPTRVEGNAIPLAMVTQDIDNDTRSATPDIGADEGTFTAPQGVPGQVTLNSPANEAEGINPITGVLSWGAPTTGGTPTEYWVYVSTSLETIFSESFTVVTLPATSLVLANVEGLVPDFSQTYYWAVQAHNSSGESDPEDPNFQIWSFTTCNQMSVASTLNLGNVWPSAPKTGTIPVQNLGTTQITFTASGSPEFEFGSTRFTVPASSTYNLPYTFNAPATTGAYTGSITLTQTLPIVVPQGITVSGNITTDVSMGDGTVNVYQPVFPYYGYTYSQTIYPASWFSYPTGYRIERLQFYWNPALAPLNTSAFKVWMGHTTQEQFPATVTSTSWIPLSQMTLVFDGTWNISAGAGWKELVLQTPFIYNRTDNLVIAFDENTSGYDTANTTSSYFLGTSTTNVYRGMSCYDDTNNFDPANPDAIAQSSFTSYASRQGYPNTRFIVAPIPVVPVISVNPETWDFGSVIVNTTNTKQFTIQNTGGGTLTISGITPASSGYFSLTGLPSFPVNLTSGRSTTFSVQYLPTAAGPHTATFTIADNRGTTPVVVNAVCVDPRITSLPHTQNFDSVTAPAFPLGWTAYKSNSSSSLYASTSYSQTSPNSAYMYNYTTTETMRLISPQVTVPMNTIRLSFYLRSGSTTYTMKVGTVSALDGTGVFTQVAAITPSTSGVFTQYSVSFADYVGTDQYICFQHGLNGTYQSFYLDSVQLEMLQPNDLAATLITGPSYGIVGTQLTYSITAYNNGTSTQNSYNVYLKKSGGSRVASLAVNTPLSPGTSAVHTLNWTPNSGDLGTYQLAGEVELTGDGNSSNNETSPLSFGVYPEGTWIENFEGGSLPSDWTLRTADTGSYNWDIYSTNPHTGAKCVSVRWESSSITNNDWLITPPLQLSATNPDNISFWLGKFSTTYSEEYQVLLSTTGTQIADFTTVLETGALPSTFTGYEMKSYNLDTFGDAEVYIAIRYMGLNKLRFYADDFVGPALYVPQEPVVTIETVPTGVKLSWPANPYAKHYKIYADDDPYGAFSGAPVTTTNTEYIFTAPAAKKFYKVVASTKTIGGRDLPEPVLSPQAIQEELDKMQRGY